MSTVRCRRYGRRRTKGRLGLLRLARYLAGGAFRHGLTCGPCDACAFRGRTSCVLSRLHLSGPPLGTDESTVVLTACQNHCRKVRYYAVVYGVIQIERNKHGKNGRHRIAHAKRSRQIFASSDTLVLRNDDAGRWPSGHQTQSYRSANTESRINAVARKSKTKWSSPCIE